MRKLFTLALAVVGFAAFTAAASACTMKTTAKTSTPTTVATTGGQSTIPNSGG